MKNIKVTSVIYVSIDIYYEVCYYVRVKTVFRESLTTTLPPEMESFIDPDKIASNVDNYPEFRWTPDAHEQRALRIVRKNLLDINLTHATASKPEHLRLDGILPFANLVDTGRYDWRSQTLALDESLGLHRYAFMHWGAFHPTQNGRYIVPVNAREALLSPNTIVTPRDISNGMFSFMDTAARDLSEEGQTRLSNYLDKIVTGSDWADIVARRALRYMQRTPDPSLYRIKNHANMGEIKHYGTISPSSVNGEVIDIRDPESLHPIWRSMIENNGVAVSYVTNALEAHEQYGYVGNDKDKLPHEIGADIEKSRKLWRNILDIAQKS